MKGKLTSDQKEALVLLKSSENIFLTGAAGSGKSYLLREYLKSVEAFDFPILASTGAAAILLGGRTFHSFFGLGIMEGGIQATVDRALNNRYLVNRLKKTRAVVIDEVSMISSKALSIAEQIARKARENSSPWGAMRIIAVGDFAQLPPVNPFQQEKEWAFLDPVWEESEFRPVVLNQIVRTQNQDFLRVLNKVRNGIIDEEVIDFLASKSIKKPKFQGTRVFARREHVDQYNFKRLDELKGSTQTFKTEYQGKESEIEKFKKQAPISEQLHLKTGALVMLRQNDPEMKWVNGSLGIIKKIQDDELAIELLTGKKISVGKSDFTLLDSDGKPVVKASNFPVTLAWAITIHKAQGTTLDEVMMNLRNLWEPGQAYVALSRARDPEGIVIEDWDSGSILTDPEVIRFHRNLGISDAETDYGI